MKPSISLNKSRKLGGKINFFKSNECFLYIFRSNYYIDRKTRRYASVRSRVATKGERNGNEGTENQPSGCTRPAVQPVRRGVERAAIIIIFTSPRVIKAARYTCSFVGAPYPQRDPPRWHRRGGRSTW